MTPSVLSCKLSVGYQSCSLVSELCEYCNRERCVFCTSGTADLIKCCLWAFDFAFKKSGRWVAKELHSQILLSCHLTFVTVQGTSIVTLLSTDSCSRGNWINITPTRGSALIALGGLEHVPLLCLFYIQLTTRTNFSCYRPASLEIHAFSLVVENTNVQACSRSAHMERIGMPRLAQFDQ